MTKITDDIELCLQEKISDVLWGEFDNEMETKLWLSMWAPINTVIPMGFENILEEILLWI